MAPTPRLCLQLQHRPHLHPPVCILQVKAELEAAQAKAAAEETSRQRDLPEAVLQDLQEVNAALR